MDFRRITTIPYDETPYSISTSADGEWLGVTSFDQKLRLYAPATMAERKKIHLGTSFPHDSAFTADAVLAGGKSLSLFDLKRFKRAGKLQHRDEIQSVGVDLASAKAVTGSGVNVVGADCSIRTWDLTTQAELSRWKLSDTVFGVDIAAGGAYVVGVSQGGDIVCGPPGAKHPSWSVQWRSWIYSALCLGAEIWVAGDMMDIGVFNADTGALLRELPVGGSTRQLAALGPEHVIVGAQNLRGGQDSARIHVLDRSGELAWVSEVCGRMFHGVAASPDGARIYGITSDPDALLVFERT